MAVIIARDGLMIRKCLRCRGAELRSGMWVLKVGTFKRRVAYHQVKDLGNIERTACGQVITKEREG